ncbi:MAG: YraN family protein [Cyanobacteriota bacterium]|nr:YraN family protein [Cyanobacteriota bacterium]
MPKPHPQTSTLGILGEELVARWLQGGGWEILHRRWRCRWGELDVVARGSGIAFVEVKTRSRGNWDEDGLLAIDRRKQEKLIQTAELYLAEFAELANLPCRFDVALVRCDRTSRADGLLPSQWEFPDAIALRVPVEVAGYRLTLQNYIESAFD